jgi:DNA processing protein
MDDQRAAYLALAQVPGIGAARLQTLLQAFESPLGACSAPLESLRALPGMSRAAASALKATSPEAGRRLLESVTEAGAVVLLPDDPDYPDLLRSIAEPPPALFALGRLELLRRPAVAIVGSRDHSRYGGQVCREVAGQAAAAGLVVVSGMARGLDAVAHAAALDAGGCTIGVLGNGFGVIYPAANRELYRRAAERGLLLTEFPPGDRPNAGSFPRRNRLISGLARVTVVVEAKAGSGALITADAALEQGREVMAVPGPVTSPVSWGTNRLIRDGATPLLEITDLLQHYPEATPPPVAGTESNGAGPGLRPLPPGLSSVEVAVARLLEAEPLQVDELAARAARPVDQVLGILSGLEIQGVVEQLTGRRFRRS